MTSHTLSYRFNQEFNCVDYSLDRDSQPMLGMSLYSHPLAPFVGFSVETSTPVSVFLQASRSLLFDRTVQAVVHNDGEALLSDIPDIADIPIDFRVIRLTSDTIRVGLMNFERKRVGIETRIIEPKALLLFLQQVSPTIFQNEQDIEAVDRFLQLLRDDMNKIAPEGAPQAFEGTGTAIPTHMEIGINNRTILSELLYPNGNGEIALTFEGNTLMRNANR